MYGIINFEGVKVLFSLGYHNINWTRIHKKTENVNNIKSANNQNLVCRKYSFKWNCQFVVHFAFDFLNVKVVMESFIIPFNTE